MKEEDLLRIINELLEDEGEDLLEILPKDYSLRDDIGFDSLALAQLTVMIENEFGVDVFEDGLISTVREIYDKVNR